MLPTFDVPSGDSNKLTEWTNEPTIRDLKTNIDDARPYTDAHTTELIRWRDNMHLTGSAAIEKIEGRSSVQPKVIRKQAEWRYSSLSEAFLSTPDLFNIEPVTAGDRSRAFQNELVLNNQINTKLNKVDFIDRYVREAVDTGSVVVKVGWHSQSETIPIKTPVYDYQVDPTGQTAEQYMGYLQAQIEDPEALTDFMTPGLERALALFQEMGIAVIPVQTGEEIIEKTIMICNHPTWEIRDQRNIIVDPTCDGDFNKANFIAETFKSSLNELKRDPKYHNVDQIQHDFTSSPLAHPDYANPDETGLFDFQDKARKKFIVYEYWGNWDVNGDGIAVPIVAAWCGNTMIRLEKNPYPDQKPPFVKAVYMPRKDSIYGEPDGELLEDNQKIIGAVTRGVIDLMGKSANSQTGMRKDMLDTVNARKFKRGEDYEFNPSVDPASGVFIHKYPEIPRSAFDLITMQNNEAESLTGVKAFNTGISSQALGNVATGVRAALDAASKRELGILRRLAQGIIDIGRKFIAMNAEFLSEEETIRITAKDFVVIRRDDLPGNFDVRLSISTAEEDNQKAQELAFMLQTTGNNMDMGMRNMILGDIARLRKMPALAKKIDEYQPQPDPLVVEEQRLKVELLRAQIAKENALAMKHAAEGEAAGARGLKDETQAQLNMAKAGEAGASARDLASAADLKDLDFLEQESGVKQERELQKIGHAAEMSTAGDLLKAELNPTGATQ